MATIKKTENGTWTLRYRDPTGRQIRSTFKKHAEAQAERAQVESDMLRGVYIDPAASKIRFGEWAARWLDTRKNLKPKTADGYESLLRVHIVPRYRNAVDDEVGLDQMRKIALGEPPGSYPAC